ncbi:MAG: GDP-mannose 4,6-dehydratase [Acidobacteriota bacterium]|nr:GDP-mannose 4,6-dehydratase [Acidobacteriota bacterium]
MKNVLITGGAGFIGSHLVDRLLEERNWQVTVVDDFNDFYCPSIKRSNIQPHLGNPNFQLIEADIRSEIVLESIFKQRNFDIIIHLAARAGVRPSLEKPHLYTETNLNGTLNLLELARRFAVPQFILGSSSSVYGCSAKLPFSESDRIANPISPYAASKAAAELLCHTYSHLYGIQMICLRFFTVYGARQRPDLAIHKFARLILEDKPVPFFGDGTTRRDYTYIGDIIAGIRAAMNYAETRYEIFNLGESETVSLCELVSLLEKHLDRKAAIEHLPPQPGDVPITFADISKARRMLGYNPQTKIEEGIKKFSDWIKKGTAAKQSEDVCDYNLRIGVTGDSQFFFA